MNQGSKIYFIIYSVCSTYISVAVFFYCYGSLIKGLYFTRTICPADTDEDRSDKKKLIITFILATAGFVIGFGPLTTLYTFLASGGDNRIDSKLYNDILNVFIFVFYGSLCLNPILYAFRSTNFQEGFKRIILCRSQSPQNY